MDKCESEKEGREGGRGKKKREEQKEEEQRGRQSRGWGEKAQKLVLEDLGPFLNTL